MSSAAPVRIAYRHNYQNLEAPEWTEEEAFEHLTETFDIAFNERPDLLEPYVVLLADTQIVEERTAIMREGLRSTLERRYPFRLL